MSKFFAGIQVIVRCMVFTLFLGLAIYYGVTFLHDKSVLSELIATALLALIIASLESIKKFNIFGLAAEFREKINDAEMTLLRIKKLEVEMFRQFVQQIVDAEIDSPKIYQGNHAMLPTSIEYKIQTLKQKTGNLCKADKAYVFQPYYLYKLDTETMKLFRNFNPQITNAKIWPDNDPFNPTDPQKVKQLIEYLCNEASCDQALVNSFVKKINPWLIKVRNCQKNNNFNNIK